MLITTMQKNATPVTIHIKVSGRISDLYLSKARSIRQITAITIEPIDRNDLF
jgi:hypothetical protein